MASIPEIPGYDILHSIGEGGMASVYLAEQKSLEREVALKVMSPALAVSEEFSDRFIKEGRITAKLSHPNLVTIFDIGVYNNIYYLAAEYIPGGTLHARLHERTMPVSEVIEVARDIAQGLGYAHEKGFVHRDVKPGNILFRANGQAVLADFGIAKAINSNTMATQLGNSIGTPHYMSPEQARAESVDGRSDLYSLGAVMFEMLTGSPPYEATDPFSIALMHVTHPVPELPAKSAWLQPLIVGLMAKDPGKRFANSDQFITACDRLFATAPQAKHIPALHQTRQSASQRSAASGEQTRAFSAEQFSNTAAWWKKPWVLGASFGIFMVIGVVAWRFAGEDAAQTKIEAPTPTRINAVSIDPSLEPPLDVKASIEAESGKDDPQPTVEVYDDTQVIDPNDLVGLLKRANAYTETGLLDRGRRIFTPQGDNAIELYQMVIAKDPENSEARVGLKRIADYFESKAKASFDLDNMTSANILADWGITAYPEHEGLRKLKKEIQKAQPPVE